ncbi:MAG: nuclear transport factor 2 family protein [Pseudonocardia sp.]|nr:nuclear transport factor 2 family protein [Pseudonocardia sp.]
MTRSPADVLDHHLKALNAGDLDELVADYAPDAVLITSGAVATGHEEIRATFASIGENLPGAVFTTSTVTEANGVILLEWTLEADAVTASDGIDTVVVVDGLITAQTARFTPVPR